MKNKLKELKELREEILSSIKYYCTYDDADGALSVENAINKAFDSHLNKIQGKNPWYDFLNNYESIKKSEQAVDEYSRQKLNNPYSEIDTDISEQKDLLDSKGKIIDRYISGCDPYKK